MASQKHKIGIEKIMICSIFSVRADLHIMHGYHVSLLTLVVRFILQCFVHISSFFAGF